MSKLSRRIEELEGRHPHGPDVEIVEVVQHGDIQPGDDVIRVFEYRQPSGATVTLPDNGRDTEGAD